MMFPEPMAKSGAQQTGKEKCMQTIAFLWFELKAAQQCLRETFAESQAPAKAPMTPSLFAEQENFYRQ